MQTPLSWDFRVANNNILASRSLADPTSPGAKLENGGLPYTESPLSFDGFN